MRQRRKQRGFTLIELMIVVALIGIISTIAFNAFSESGTDTRRTRAFADISALNDSMSRYYQTNFTYTGATLNGLIASGNIALTTEYVYIVTVNPDGQGYNIQVSPSAVGSQQGDGAMYIDNTGRRCYYAGDDSPDWGTCPHTF